MIMKCSECGGDVKTTIQTNSFKVVRCMKCGRERKFEEKIIETIDMSNTANLSVLME
jgi:DNA-directed RNA polymerase subunit M/transcription elongation factor TFIIS